MVTLNPHFSPTWDDSSVLLPESLLFNLSFPPESLRTPDKSIWVDSMWMRTEEWRGKEVVLERSRKVIGIMRPAEISPTAEIEFKNRAGKQANEAAEQALIEAFFPPRGWMADTLVERSMMLLAARETKGKVLVGGLGLGRRPPCANGIGVLYASWDSSCASLGRMCFQISLPSFGFNARR